MTEPDAALEYDRNQQFPTTIWEKACGLGFIGVHFPEEYGGQGCGVFENVLITEAFCRQDSGIGMALTISDFGSEMILRNGNDNQKRKILPFIAQGKGMATHFLIAEQYPLHPSILDTLSSKIKENEEIKGFY